MAPHHGTLVIAAGTVSETIGWRVLFMLSLPMFMVQLIRWRCMPWLPSYAMDRRRKRSIANSTGSVTDLVVVVVDHFEPSRRKGEEGIREMRRWCERYGELAQEHTDWDGRPLQHTWFYRYDYPEPRCVSTLAEFVYKGLGEIEFHLHHGNDTPSSFERTIAEGVDWFNRWGAMVSWHKRLQRKFAYIAGNWALDNGMFDDALSGVNTELSILARNGCYADFTFPAFAARSQPRKVNSIYYAKDTPRPKSYDRGIDVERGRLPRGDLMIFQGPLFVDYWRGAFDYAALESFAPYESSRLKYWIQSHVHVLGAPEWLFIKLHTHGMQSSDEFLEGSLARMCGDLHSYASANGLRLHYATAREAYNMCKAAEACLGGDAARYRDYQIARPLNRWLLADSPYHVEEVEDGTLRVRFVSEHGAKIVKVSGHELRVVNGMGVRELLVQRRAGKPSGVEFLGQGRAEVTWGGSSEGAGQEVELPVSAAVFTGI